MRSSNAGQRCPDGVGIWVEAMQCGHQSFSDGDPGRPACCVQSSHTPQRLRKPGCTEKEASSTFVNRHMGAARDFQAAQVVADPGARSSQSHHVAIRVVVRNHPLAAGSERSVFFAENGSKMSMCTLMMLFQL